MEIIEGGGGVGWFKGGAFGGAGTGKTTTGIIIGNGIKNYFNLPGDIYVFDTEKGSEYVNALSKVGGRYGVKGTGKNLKICKSRSYSDFMAFLGEAEKNRAAFFLADSMTHVREELMATMLERVNRALTSKGKSPLMKLEFHHTAAIADLMSKLSTRYLNAEMHMLLCGRSQTIWKMEENEETGKKELNAIGTKMKVGNEMAYEPSLLFEMEVQRDKSGNAGARRVCTIWKDRFGLLDGQQCENPTFDFFLPFVQLLTPNAVDTVDATTQTNIAVTEDGNTEWAQEKRERAIAWENIRQAARAVWPSESASEKWCRFELLWKLFETRSETELENMRSDRLKAAFPLMQAKIDEVKNDLAERNAKEAAQEAAEKAAKKKPEKAEKVVS